MYRCMHAHCICSGIKWEGALVWSVGTSVNLDSLLTFSGPFVAIDTWQLAHCERCPAHVDT